MPQATDTKLAQLTRLWAAGDKLGALRIAAKFPRLGAHKVAITRAWAAHQHPSTYTAMRKDPAALVAAGLAAMADKYGLEG